MKVQRCRGMRDLMPQDMAKFRLIEAAFRECCLGWGYQEIRTPILEYLHLFTSAGTLSPHMLGRVYSFLDWDGWSGERVVLRPDGTIPAARLYVENLQTLPVARLFYSENMFAFEAPGEQSRERWQCGVELIGGSKRAGDAELISLALEAMGRLEIGEVEVRLAHAGFLKAFLEELGFSGEEEAGVLDQIFAGQTGAVNSVKESYPELDKRLRILFSLKGNSPGFIENLRGIFLSEMPALGPSLEEMAIIANLLTSLGIDYQIDFTSGRGFEYYTGVIFSFYTSGRRLGGGGRYDELVSLIGGKDVCASGFALYMDELASLLRDLPARERILVRVSGADDLKARLAAVRLLRDAGYIAELDMGYSDTRGFRWIVDLTADSVIELTDLVSGKKRRRSSSKELLRIIKEAGCE